MGYRHVVLENGTKETYLFGKLHSESDRPAVVEPSDWDTYSVKWYKQGKLHRNHGGLTILTYLKKGTLFNRCEWYRDGVRHKENGASIIVVNEAGVKRSWHYNGVQVCRDFQRHKNVTHSFLEEHNMLNLRNWTIQQRVLFTLRFGGA